MDARETLKLISKQWCNLNDLMLLAEIGKNNAVKLRKEIKQDLINQGYTLPNNRLLMVFYKTRGIKSRKRVSNNEY